MGDAVLITGASRGLGAALYYVFNEHDYYCIINCRGTSCDFGNLSESGRTYHVCGDIRDPWILNRVGCMAIEKGIKVLINNAGVYSNQPLDQITNEELQSVYSLNLMVPMMLTKAVWPSLKEQGGIVVNINSLAGQTGSDKELVYCATKHGLAGFSKSLQYQGTKDGVRVLNIYFGAMNTDMMKGRTETPDRLIDPMEAARLVYDMCRDYSSLRITEVTVARRRY